MGKRETHLNSIVDYIKKNSRKGYDRDSLKWALVNQGNMKHEVEKAFQIADQELAREAPKATPMPEPKMEVMPEPEPEKKGFFKKLFG